MLFRRDVSIIRLLSTIQRVFVEANVPHLTVLGFDARQIIVEPISVQRFKELLKRKNASVTVEARAQVPRCCIF